ncbi:MAG TPA: helix-turn-helix domain-containing protein [Propionibacteriaceae bacterium]
MPTPTDPITTAQVADEYGLSRRSIGRRIADGELTPLMKLPGSTGAYLFQRSEIERAFGKAGAA